MLLSEYSFFSLPFLPALLGTYDRPTEQPTNQQTDYDNNILTLVSV